MSATSAGRPEDSYQVRWANPSYDLSRLQHADAIVSYWGLRSIAHAMVSFAFDDGRHLVFSVEIRKKRGQAFSAIGGFFKQYEMILIAATEPDIIGVRTNVRMEDTYLLPLNAQADTLRSLFEAYVGAANRLAAQTRVVQHHHLQLHHAGLPHGAPPQPRPADGYPPAGDGLPA